MWPCLIEVLSGAGDIRHALCSPHDDPVLDPLIAGELVLDAPLDRPISDGDVILLQSGSQRLDRRLVLLFWLSSRETADRGDNAEDDVVSVKRRSPQERMEEC
jgi:hypothetical protein